MWVSDCFVWFSNGKMLSLLESSWKKIGEEKVIRAVKWERKWEKITRNQLKLFSTNVSRNNDHMCLWFMRYAISLHFDLLFIYIHKCNAKRKSSIVDMLCCYGVRMKKNRVPNSKSLCLILRFSRILFFTRFLFFSEQSILVFVHWMLPICGVFPPLRFIPINM